MTLIGMMFLVMVVKSDEDVDDYVDEDIDIYIDLYIDTNRKNPPKFLNFLFLIFYSSQSLISS